MCFEYCNIHLEVNETGFTFISKEGYAIRKIHNLTPEFRVQFHLRTQYRTNHVKFMVEFPRRIMKFPTVFINRDVCINCVMWFSLQLLSSSLLSLLLSFDIHVIVDIAVVVVVVVFVI